MITSKLKTAINEEVRNNGDILLAISKATGSSIGTVRNWFYLDSKMLTNYDALSVIARFTNKPIEDLIEESETEKV